MTEIVSPDALFAGCDAARNPATPATSLHRLLRARAREVRALVAGNPNTDVDDLDVLTRQFASEVAGNPILDWLTMSDTDWLADWSETSRHRLLAAPECPVGLLWWAQRFGEDDDRVAVIANPKCPPELLQVLLRDGWEEARHHVSASEEIQVKSNESGHRFDRLVVLTEDAAQLATCDLLADLLAADLVPDEWIDRMGIPSEIDAQHQLAVHPRVKPEILNRFLVDDDLVLQRLALRHPNVPEGRADLWDRLRADDPTLTAEELSLFAESPGARECLARQRHLPLGPLADCVADGSWRVREAAARNQSLTTEFLAALVVDGDRDVRAAAAGNTLLPKLALIGLSLDPDLIVQAATIAALKAREAREARDVFGLASASVGEADPTSPFFSLERRAQFKLVDLAVKRPSEVAAIVSEVMTDADPVVRLALACNPTLPDSARVRFATDTESAVRAQVAERTLSAVVLEELLSDSVATVRAAAVANSRTPAWLFGRFAGVEFDEDVLGAILQRADVSDAVMSGLCGHETDEVDVEELRALVHGIDLVTAVSAETLALIASKGWVAFGVLRRPDQHGEILRVLAASPNWRIRQGAAAHVATPLDCLLELSTDPDNDVRSAVATNPAVDPASVPSFFTETDQKVRRALMSRPDLSPELIDRHLLDDAGIRQAALQHPQLSPSTREVLDALHTGDPIAEEVLARLGEGSSRRLVAQHPFATEAILHDFVADSSWTVREAVARHSACGVEDLVALSSDPDRDVRAAVASHHATPVDVLVELVADSDARVRRAAASNPSAPGDVCENWIASVASKVVHNDELMVRVLGLSADDVSPVVLRRRNHWRSIHWAERYAVAAHLATPEFVLEALSTDADVRVRSAAQASLDTRSEAELS